MISLKDLTTDSLISTYSGRPGCACGCRGKHSYTDHGFKTLSASHQSYATESLRGARTILGTFLKLAEAGAKVEWADGDFSFAAIETETRLYILYLTPNAAQDFAYAAKQAIAAAAAIPMAVGL